MTKFEFYFFFFQAMKILSCYCGVHCDLSFYTSGSMILWQPKLPTAPEVSLSTHSLQAAPHFILHTSCCKHLCWQQSVVIKVVQLSSVHLRNILYTTLCNIYVINIYDLNVIYDLSVYMCVYLYTHPYIYIFSCHRVGLSCQESYFC